MAAEEARFAGIGAGGALTDDFPETLSPRAFDHDVGIGASDESGADAHRKWRQSEQRFRRSMLVHARVDQHVGSDGRENGAEVGIG